MQVIKTIKDLKTFRAGLKQNIGFVPTMGALHEGHVSLIRRCLEENAHTIVSIYVNPTQFLEGEDLERYPRTIESDIKTLTALGVDALFLPTNLYAKDEVSVKAPQTKGYVLEGLYRPGHFDGVLTVVLKLLNATAPTHAYFGKKDAQQYILIKQMVQNLFLNTDIVGLPTLRDSDGLAKSSRNIYLNNTQRKRALSIYNCLNFIEKNIYKLALKDLKKQALKLLELDHVQYLEFTDQNLQKIQSYKKGDTLVSIAGYLGSTRLIDNLWI